MSAARALGLARSILRHRTGRRDRPRMLTHTVCFACNARCVMCDSWRIRAGDDLSLAQIEAIYAQLPPMDVVRLTGGEPFLRPDLGAIAEAARRQLAPMLLHVTTNGFSTERILRFCEERERSLPLHLLVSIDGLAETHVRVRGRPSAFQRALATLEALAPRRAELRLDLAVNQTVVDERAAGEHRALCELLRPLGVPVQLVVAYEQSATYSVERGLELAPEERGGYASFGALPPAVLERLFAEARAELEALPFVERHAKRYYLRGLEARARGDARPPSPPCVALSAHLRLLPNGDVPVCQFNGRVVGNLARQRFAELWDSDRALAEREWVRRCPGCWAECEVLPSAVYSGDPRLLL